jgi:hypothetical protein
VRRGAVVRWACCLLFLNLLVGCRSTNGDRLPATAVDNPDPLWGSQGKLKTTDKDKDPQSEKDRQPAVAAANEKQPSPERIGKLTVQPPPKSSKDTSSSSGTIPTAASLTSQVREPKPVVPVESPVQPAQATLSASDPMVVQNYRQRLTPFGVVGLRTKNLGASGWEASAHFPVPGEAQQLRRIEAQGATESDALLAIVEQVEKKK